MKKENVEVLKLILDPSTKELFAITDVRQTLETIIPVPREMV